MVLHGIMIFFTYRILNEVDGLIFVFQIPFKAYPLQKQYPLSIFV